MNGYICVKSLQSCLTLCDPMDFSPPDSSVHGILLTRILEWEAIPFSRDLPDPGSNPGLLLCSQILYHLHHQGSPLRSYAVLCCAKSLPSCLTLCDPMDCSLPGSCVHGIFQARILEWVAMPSSRGSSWPRDWTHVSYISCSGRRILHH